MLEQTTWSNYRARHPGVRIREAAANLGVSEVELLSTELGGNVVRLRPDWAAIFTAVGRLGKVKTITRNEHVVLERIASYGAVELSAHVGLALGDIDLRIFPRNLASAFAVVDPGDKRTLRSVQIFDPSGTSVHKIYLESDEETARVDFATLVQELRAENQEPAEVRREQPLLQRRDEDIDVDGMRAAWDAMRDTHDFFEMCQKFGVTRTQALRLAGEPRTVRLGRGVLDGLLKTVSERKLPIMIFVGNRGMIQIYTGPIERVVATGPWLNVLDPEFNLHARSTAVTDVWLVRKPTSDGIVTSVELFNERGETLAMLFGRRKPGIPESTEWRALAERLERLA